MFEVTLRRVTRSFGSFHALKDVSLVFPAGSTTCLLGPSGCGKTTLVRLVAGLDTPTSGQILFGGEEVQDLPARERDVAMVFQYPVVYRGLSVAENIELPLRAGSLGARERRERVREAIALLGLEAHLRDHPDRFDNSVRQRVAFARAVARRSSLLLFDEPITNVDPDARFRLKQDLRKLTRQLRQTIVYVTHDQNEAMTLADQIVLLRDGEVLQQAAPRPLYDRPAQTFGGWFLGSPGMNFLEHGTAPGGAGGGVLHSDLFPFPVTLPAGVDQVILGIRPEQVRLHREPHPAGVPATVQRKFRGVAGQFLVTLQLARHQLRAKVAPELGRSLGERVWAECPPEATVVFDAAGRAVPGHLGRAAPAG